MGSGDGDLSRVFSRVERDIRALNGPVDKGLAGIAGFLLRSEVIASSRIEGIAPSTQQVALAELGQAETVRGVYEQAKLVANNMPIVREATILTADRQGEGPSGERDSSRPSAAVTACRQ